MLHGGSGVDLVSICTREWEQKNMLLAAFNLLSTLQPLKNHFTHCFHTLFAKQFTPDRFTFAITPSKNQLSKLENHGAELYQTSP
jgi:hypothetical protein